MHPRILRFAFRILATDISTRVLETAKAGIYSRPLTAPVPAALRRKYLLQSKSDRNSLRIKPALRESIGFHCGDACVDGNQGLLAHRS
jgi:chemotaxis protein methyltransferase CheR